MLAPAPASSPKAPTVAVVVVGSDNRDAGRVVEVVADNVLLDTGTHRVTVAANTVGRTDRGFYIGSIKAQLEAAITAARGS